MEYAGYIAALLVTGSFLPQALLTIRTRDTEGISLLMYIMFVAGVLLWLCYGILMGDMAQIIANGIISLLSGFILILKIKDVISG